MQGCSGNCSHGDSCKNVGDNIMLDPLITGLLYFHLSQIIFRLYFLLVSGLTVLPPDEVEVEYEDEEEILVWALLELANGWPHPASLLHTSPLNTATVKVSAGDHPLLADSRTQPQHVQCTQHTGHTAIYLGN